MRGLKVSSITLINDIERREPQEICGDLNDKRAHAVIKDI